MFLSLAKMQTTATKCRLVWFFLRFNLSVTCDFNGMCSRFTMYYTNNLPGSFKSCSKYIFIYQIFLYFYLLLLVSNTNLLLLFFCKISVARQSFVFKVPGIQTNKNNLKIFQNVVLYISRNHADFLLLWT